MQIRWHDPTQNDVKQQNMEYLCIYSLEGWCIARTTFFDNSYDDTIATYSLPNLYLPKTSNSSH